MRLTVLLFFAFFLESFIVPDHFPLRYELSSNAGPVYFETDSIRQDTMPQGVTANAEIRFVNRGNVPVLIETISNGCGCANADWSKAPVAPGAVSIIKLTFNSAGKMGPYHQPFEVHFAGNENPPIVLHLTGFVLTTEKKENAFPAPVKNGIPVNKQ